MASLPTWYSSRFPQARPSRTGSTWICAQPTRAPKSPGWTAPGARQVSIGQGTVSWVVMADPDGNEFDVLQPLAPDELPPGHDALGRRIAAGARA